MNKNNQSQQFSEGIQVIGGVLNKVGNAFKSYAEEHKDEIKALIDYFENFEEINGEIWKTAAENGWFPNEFLAIDFMNYVIEGKDSLDTYMLKELEETSENIHKSLIDEFPERKHILDVAFNLHAQENYIAAIPLFLSQTDGICAQKIGRYLFTEHDKRISKIQDFIEKYPEKVIILAPLLQNTQFGASISKGSRKLKDKAPNRSGILHGSRKHLDYGTKLNSLKCISLLGYISSMFDDV